MSPKNTLSILAEELAKVFAPLQEALDSPEYFTVFMLGMGWNLTQIPSPVKNLVAPLTSMSKILEAGEVDIAEAVQLLNAIRVLITGINQIKGQPNNLFPASVDANQFKTEFPQQLMELLIADYLFSHHPTWGNLCRGLGIIQMEEVAAAGSRRAYYKRNLAWNNLAGLLSDPFTLLKNFYQWGTSDFKAEDLAANFARVANTLRVNFYFCGLEDQVENYLASGALQPDQSPDWVLRLPIVENPYFDDPFKLGVELFLLPETAAAKPGFALLPYGSGEFSKDIKIADKLVLKVEGGMDLEGGVGILVRPGQAVEVAVDIIPAGGKAPSAGVVAIALETTGGADSKTMLIGSEDGSCFAIGAISLKGGARVDSLGNNDVYIELKCRDAAMVIKPGVGEADSFLSSLLPKDGFTIDFSILLGFSTSQGFYFGGSGGLEVSLPAHLQVGPLEIMSCTLAIKPASGTIPFDIGATLQGNLGPLKAVVENIGLSAKFSFPPDSSGNLGPVDLSLGFKPPTGVGLSIDAGVVKGGGYLRFSEEEYSGALELVFANYINLKGIGLISTRLPDGSQGFSLIVIITAEFGAGIQLGYGFVLLGVGGLLGLNRTMCLQPLMEGVRTGSLNSIMFPKDVIAEAPRIISDLRTIFPPEEDKFLIGPMAKLGWGTPPLISVSLGIIIEIPGNIAILGVFRVALPNEYTPILVLQVNFAGAIEFDKKRLYFFASLFESRILFITIDGEMVLLTAWGEDANFLNSVGGFHPQFKPPILPFPSPKRVAFNILDFDNARILVMGYFAVTSNTVQFGAHAELYFGFSCCNLSGHLGFDALMQFSPFYFIVQISGSVSLKVFGMGLFSISLRLSLEGPTPWKARGTGSISFFFFSISVDFEVIRGEAIETSQEDIEVMPLLKAEYGKLENWTAHLPEGNHLLVSLRKLEETEGLVLHPVGTLEITQKAVPLEITIDKVGNQKVKDANKFALAVAAGDLVKIGDTKEMFAMAQFQEMDDSSKLSRPAFEPQPSGIRISVKGEQLASSCMVKRKIDYEVVIIDSNYKRDVLKFYRLAKGLFQHFLGGCVAAKSELSRKRAMELKPFKDKIKVQPILYTVAFNTNNQAYRPEAMDFASEALAREYMQQQCLQDPNLTDLLHVLPQSEVSVSP
jgi:hypothetical protein